MPAAARKYHNSLVTVANNDDDSGDYAVHGYSILTTDTVIFEALENPSGHMTQVSLDSVARKTMGRVRTRPIPQWIAELPYDDYRTSVVGEWYKESYASAREIIRAAYPQADALVEAGVASWHEDELHTDVETADAMVAEEEESAARAAEQESEIAAENAWMRAAEYDEENQAQLERDDAQYGDPIPADLDEQWDALHASQVETFKRKLRNLEGSFRRLDSGELTGRNATGSDATRRMHYEQLRDLARIDAVCDALDADEKLAARWNRVERRSVGASA